ncbi:hypothetical protein [Moorena producens]|uniref:hypothetical protein n=1 Tax=Moorena producens TaxID=1155739 RepID=UPI003C755FF5
MSFRQHWITENDSKGSRDSGVGVSIQPSAVSRQPSAVSGGLYAIAFELGCWFLLE